MYWTELLRRSKEHWQAKPGYASLAQPFGIFNSGAYWMAGHMGHAAPASHTTATVPFWLYGLLKYGLSLSASVCTAIILFRVHPGLTVLSVLAFYLVEVHFLFLFPLLIDGVPHPLRTSIVHTYRLGLLHTLLTVMPIACYMVLGLARPARPLYNWHIGCLAIIIWYQDAHRGRQ